MSQRLHITKFSPPDAFVKRRLRQDGQIMSGVAGEKRLQVVCRPDFQGVIVIHGTIVYAFIVLTFTIQF